MNNTELSVEQLKSCTGGAGWFIPAGYIIAKEGAKAIQFYKDAKANYENGDDVDVAILKAGHSSGTIEDWILKQNSIPSAMAGLYFLKSSDLPYQWVTPCPQRDRSMADDAENRMTSTFTTSQMNRHGVQCMKGWGIAS